MSSRRVVSIVPLLLLLTSTLAHPEERRIRSSLGFTASIGDDWTFLSREEVKANPDLFESVYGRLETFNPDLVAVIRQEIEAGRVDFLFLPSSSDGFRDNINIRKQIGQQPQNEAEVDETCGSLATELPKALGQPVQIHRCGQVELPVGKALFLDSTMGRTSNRTIQYYLSRSQAVLVVVTGTFTAATLADSRGALEAFVRSIEFD